MRGEISIESKEGEGTTISFFVEVDYCGAAFFFNVLIDNLRRGIGRKNSTLPTLRKLKGRTQILIRSAHAVAQEHESQDVGRRKDQRHGIHRCNSL